MNLSGVKLGYFYAWSFFFIRGFFILPRHPKQVLYQAEPRADIAYLSVIINININKCKLFNRAIYAHKCIKTRAKEDDQGGKNGVRPAFNHLKYQPASMQVSTSIFTRILSNTIKKRAQANDLFGRSFLSGGAKQ